jgi:hypothetical protein
MRLHGYGGLLFVCNCACCHAHLGSLNGTAAAVRVSFACDLASCSRTVSDVTQYLSFRMRRSGMGITGGTEAQLTYLSSQQHAQDAPSMAQKGSVCKILISALTHALAAARFL